MSRRSQSSSCSGASPGPSSHHGRPRALLLGILVVLAGVAGLDGSARADWPRPRAGFELGAMHFRPIVDYLRFEQGDPGSGIPDVPEERQLEYGDTGFSGFSLGLAPHPDLSFAWTRHTGSSKLHFRNAGRELFDGEVVDGVTVRLPEFDYTLQVFSVRWAPGRLRWRGTVGPVVGVGWGWIDQEQQGELNTDGLPLEWSFTDDVTEAMIGLEVRAPWVHAGTDLRLYRWKYDTEESNVPNETSGAWMWAVWLRAAL